MGELKHWTERSTDDFLYKIGWDFVAQIERLIDSGETTQAALAEKLGVSKGRVSQVLNNPGNITLKNIVRYARALGKKVSIVAYDDGDPDNHKGPVNSEIFLTCWERAGGPADFFSLNDGSSYTTVLSLPDNRPNLQGVLGGGVDSSAGTLLTFGVRNDVPAKQSGAGLLGILGDALEESTREQFKTAENSDFFNHANVGRDVGRVLEYI